MLRTILIYGAIAGVIVGALMSAVVLGTGHALPAAIGMAIGYLTMLVALSLVFVAIKRRRDRELGGVIRFWPALGIGVGISVVAGIFYVAAWDLTLTVTNFDLMTMMVEQKRAEGASAAELAKFRVEMAEFAKSYANPLVRWPLTFSEIFPVGLLVSLVSAALLSNPRFLPARASGNG